MNSIISYKKTILEALSQINELSAENNLTLFVVDVNKKLIGTLTDGDIRRFLVNGGSLDSEIIVAMCKDYFCIFSLISAKIISR